MKKLIALLLVVMMVMCLFAGCGNGGEDTVTPTPTPASTPSPTPDNTNVEPTPPENESIIKKVALVTDVGTIDDESFNQGTWEGVEAFCKENNIEYTYYQPTADSTDARALSITQAINEGANVIVMPGFLFAENAIEMPADYPDVYFIAIDIATGDLTYDYETWYDPAPNLVCITFSEEQAGYLAGYAAVKDGYTKLGFLGGMAVPAVVRYGYGYVQGADAAAEELGIDIEVSYTYGGQFYGDASITAKMEGWYQSGTEIVFACGGGIYTSAVEAALQYNGMVIGVDSDQHYIGEAYAYNPFLTSAMKLLPNATSTALSTLQSGNWADYSGKGINYSLDEGEYVGLPTASASWCFESFTIAEYEDIVAQIMNGSVEIDSGIDAMPAVSEYTTVREIG